MENGHLKWIYPLKIVIFHSYVKLPEGTRTQQTATCGDLKQTIGLSREWRKSVESLEGSTWMAQQKVTTPFRSSLVAWYARPTCSHIITQRYQCYCYSELLVQ